MVYSTKPIYATSSALSKYILASSMHINLKEREEELKAFFFLYIRFLSLTDGRPYKQCGGVEKHTAMAIGECRQSC